MSLSRIESADAMVPGQQGTAYAWYVVFILTACYTLSFIDSRRVPDRMAQRQIRRAVWAALVDDGDVAGLGVGGVSLLGGVEPSGSPSGGRLSQEGRREG